MELHHCRCGASHSRPPGIWIAWGPRAARDRLRAGADYLVNSTLDWKCEGRPSGALFFHAARLGRADTIISPSRWFKKSPSGNRVFVGG